MSKRTERNLVVALDIGTSKVVALVGEVKPDGSIEVVGLGSQPSRGLKRGVVVNIDSTVQSIQRAVEEAELMTGVQVGAVYTGIAGSHVRSLNSSGVVAIRDKEVSSVDIARVMEAAGAVARPQDQRILHVIPQEYIIDNQEGIREPIGMSGVRLEARVHVVTCADSAAQNVIKCVERCGLAVEEIILEPWASSFALLSEDEKELGVCLVDIGGGTTDIAVMMRTPTPHAEDIKLRYACALSQMTNIDETIEVPSVAGRPPRRLARQMLAEIVQKRYEELFRFVAEELRRSGYAEAIAAGIVLTGGSARMEGAADLAEEMFNVPVRLGIPAGVAGAADVVRNPMYATAVGLLLYGRQNMELPGAMPPLAGRMAGALGRLKGWLQGHL